MVKTAVIAAAIPAAVVVAAVGLVLRPVIVLVCHLDQRPARPHEGYELAPEIVREGPGTS